MNEIGRKHGQVAANHSLTYARAAINWCIKNGLTKATNPWVGISKFKTKSRERFLRPNELQSFFEHLENLNEDIRDYIYMSLYTGARRANVLAMRWDEIDFETKTWTIPRTKSGDSQVVPLTTRALEVLSRRHDVNEKSDNKKEWVFPGKGKTGHLVEPNKQWNLLLTNAKIDDLRLHDLRRTLGSYMAMGNQSLHIIGKALGHRSVTATQIYARLASDPIRQAMEKAQDDISRAAKPKPDEATTEPLDQQSA